MNSGGLKVSSEVREAFRAISEGQPLPPDVRRPADRGAMGPAGVVGFKKYAAPGAINAARFAGDARPYDRVAYLAGVLGGDEVTPRNAEILALVLDQSRKSAA